MKIFVGILCVASIAGILLYFAGKWILEELVSVDDDWGEE